MFVVEIKQIFKQSTNAVAVVKPVTRLKFATENGAILFALKNNNRNVIICVFDENEPEKKMYP